MNLNFSAGESPLLSRQNPVIYSVIAAALVLIAVFFAVWFLLLTKRRKEESPEWIEKEKKRPTKFKDIKKISRFYPISAEEQELLWYICRKYSVANIFYSIKKFNELEPVFKQAYNDLKAEGEEARINKLFILKFKLDKAFAESINLTSTVSLPPKTKLELVLPNGSSIACILDENTKDYLSVSIQKESPAMHTKPEPLTKVAFTFLSSTGMSYAFITRIIRYETKNESETMILAHSTDLIKKTRKKFKRKDIKESCRFSSIKIEKDKNGNTNYIPTEKKFTGTLINISGSGCCISSVLPIREEQIIYIELDLHDGTYSTIGKIVRTRKSPQPGVYNLHIKFIKISIEIQNKILAKVYSYD